MLERFLKNSRGKGVDITSRKKREKRYRSAQMMTRVKNEDGKGEGRIKKKTCKTTIGRDEGRGHKGGKKEHMKRKRREWGVLQTKGKKSVLQVDRL